MALVSCPICDHKVSYKAPNCPKCGEPDPSRQKRNSKLLTKLAGLIMIVVAGSYLWFVVIPDIQQHGLLNQTNQKQ